MKEWHMVNVVRLSAVFSLMLSFVVGPDEHRRAQEGGETFASTFPHSVLIRSCVQVISDGRIAEEGVMETG